MDVVKTYKKDWIAHKNNNGLIWDCSCKREKSHLVLECDYQAFSLSLSLSLSTKWSRKEVWIGYTIGMVFGT